VDHPVFTAPDTWTGGFYELAIELGPRSDERLDLAVQAIWRFPGLCGPYPSADVEPNEKTLVAAGIAALKEHHHLLGLAALPGGSTAPCGVVAVREDGGTDWLAFYLPLGGLDQAYPVGGYPFDDDTDHRQWRKPLEGWLAELGRVVFDAVPFRLGLIGFEVSGTRCAAALSATGIPAERWIGHLWPQAGGLQHHATTRWR
jgi:hypothetical protein